ncbi:MAG TPA: metalloregulator ArsR/SmtB family transcription factor [Tepidisphaeraceae bacterium]|nr:metalloregulator ArsR/SmtB family transcription factor [Tepidisphaeraceae bacterium]
MTNHLDQLLAIASALADEGRLRALLAIRRAGQLCLCQITELLALAPSTVSKHLSILRQAGLIEARKQGRWMYFHLPEHQQTPPAVRGAIQWVASSLARDPRAVEDARRLKQILAENPEELCKRQCERRGCCSSAPATPAAARWPKAGHATSAAT